MFYNSLFSFLKIIKRYTYYRLRVIISRPHYSSIEKQIRLKSRNGPLRVCFLVTVISKWKDEELYKLLAKSSRFVPIIIGTPYALERYDSTRSEEQRKVREYCLSRSYNYYDSYDEKTRCYRKLDTFSPDIVFLCEPYEGNLEESYRICRKKINYLPCHTPYAYWIEKVIRPATGEYHAISWRQYYCSEANRLNIKKYSYIGDKNVRIVGYQTLDKLSNTLIETSPWKEDKRKKIIIAPHYSIVSPNRPGSNQGGFLFYADYLLELVNRYRDKVLFAFKPHPQLYVTLIDIWGKEKTDSYYNFWKIQENTIIADGDYIDLFKTSDAMVHDSGSFVVEYLFTKKPTMFIAYKEKAVKEDYSDFGISCVDMHYKAYQNSDIEEFIKNVVINEKDFRKEERSQFVDKNFGLVNEKPAAENIYNDIISSCIR